MRNVGYYLIGHNVLSAPFCLRVTSGCLASALHGRSEGLHTNNSHKAITESDDARLSICFRQNPNRSTVYFPIQTYFHCCVRDRILKEPSKRRKGRRIATGGQQRIGAEDRKSSAKSPSSTIWSKRPAT